MIGHFIQRLHQGISPDRSMCNGGGSGGGSSGVKYDNLEKLYGTQQQAAQFMLDQAMPQISNTLGNSSSMVDEAMNGTLADRARGQAGADASAAMGQAITGAGQHLDRFGSTMNQNALGAQTMNAALQGAASKANAMNKATQWAEDQKWNRNAGLYAQASGTGNGAMQGMTNAGAGFSNMANQQNQNNMANAQGYGQFGAAVGYGMTKADGGYIKAPGLANGGDAWSAYKKANPVTVSGSSGTKRGNPLMQIMGGAAGPLLGKGLKEAFKGKDSSLYKDGKDWWDHTTFEEGPSADQYTVPTEQGFDNYYAPASDYTVQTDAASNGADVATAGTSAADAATTAESLQAASEGMSLGADAGSELLSNAGNFSSGGSVKKKGLCLAMGGVANPIAKNQVADEDANMSMPKVSQMDDKPSGLPSQAQQGANDLSYSGNTTGMGESSPNDKDGFGKEHGDYRHAAGTTTLKVVGNTIFSGLGTLLGDVVGDAIHPIMEPVTRGGIMFGDTVGRAVSGNSKTGGAVGAVLTDPIGAWASGKYFNAGGRVDHTNGGKVSGPGTETSDDIPAWLSDGEVVENAEAVKMPTEVTKEVINDWEQSGGDTKELLLAINDKGREIRQGKKNMFACGGMMKHGVKLAGGGFLGGNMGIALGSGVNEWNKQRAFDEQKAQADRSYELQKQNTDLLQKAETRHQAEFDNKQAEFQNAQNLKNELSGIQNKYATIGSDVAGYINQSNADAEKAAKSVGAEFTPLTQEQQDVIKQSVAKGKDQEFSNAFNTFAMPDKAEYYDKKIKDNAIGKKIAGAITDPVLKEYAESGDVDKTAALYIKDKEAQAMIEARKEAQASAERQRREHDSLMAQLRREQMEARGTGGGRVGSRSGGSGGSDEMKPDDFRQQLVASIPEDGFSAVKDGKVISTMSRPDAISQASSRFGGIKALNQGIDNYSAINASIEATKFHNGIKPNGEVGFEADGRGNFVPVLTTKEATGSRKIAIGEPIPYNQMASLNKDKLKSSETALPNAEMMNKAEMQWNIRSLEEAKEKQAKFQRMTPAEVAALDPVSRKRLQNLDAEIPRLEALISAYAEPYGREARGIVNTSPVQTQQAPQKSMTQSVDRSGPFRSVPRDQILAQRERERNEFSAWWDKFKQSVGDNIGGGGFGGFN